MKRIIAYVVAFICFIIVGLYFLYAHTNAIVPFELTTKNIEMIGCEPQDSILSNKLSVTDSLKLGVVGKTGTSVSAQVIVTVENKHDAALNCRDLTIYLFDKDGFLLNSVATHNLFDIEPKKLRIVPLTYETDISKFRRTKNARTQIKAWYTQSDINRFNQESIQEKIALYRQLKVGMSRVYIRTLLGPPLEVTTNSFYESEHWKYSENCRLRFHQGKLESWNVKIGPYTISESYN